MKSKHFGVSQLPEHGAFATFFGQGRRMVSTSKHPVLGVGLPSLLPSIARVSLFELRVLEAFSFYLVPADLPLLLFEHASQWIHHHYLGCLNSQTNKIIKLFPKLFVVFLRIVIVFF